MASLISSSADPEPPWKTRSKGLSLPYFWPTASWMSFSTDGRSLTWPGLYTPCTLPNVAARRYRPRSPSPTASAVARASSGVVYSFSLISPTTPSSSPPTTPISISMTMRAAAHSASSSAAIWRFSGGGRELRQRHRARHHVLDRARQVLRAAGRYLDDPVAAGLGESAQRGVQRLARGAVDRGERETSLFRRVQHLRVDLWGRDRHGDDSLGLET